MRLKTFSSAKSNTLIFMKQMSGGAGKAAIQYANIFVAYGFNVIVVSGRSDPDVLSKLSSNARHIEVGMFWRFPPLLRLSKSIRKYSPKIVLSVGMSNGSLIAITKRIGARSFTFLHREANSPIALLESQSRFRKIFGKLEARITYKLADRIICLTNAMQQEIIDLKFVCKEKLIYIPNAVAASTSEISAASRSPHSPATIVCIARLTTQKDYPTLLRAFAHLRKKLDCRLKIAGNGPERARLLSLVSELGVQNDVEFLGHITDPSQLYLHANLCVLSSVFEGFPNVLIEALAQGCPVVATDCPTGPAEVIHSDTVGCLSRMGDPKDLAAKMECALGRNFDAKELRARAKHFSEERLRQRIFELLATV